MTRHIHIHLPAAKTRDAGFDESKVKRNHGQFATSAGNAEHHLAQAAKHDAKRKDLPSMHYAKHDLMKASARHEEAARYLQAAENAHKAGNKELAGEHMKHAEIYAQHAKQHEAAIPNHVDAPAVAPAAAQPQAKSTNSLNHQEWQSAIKQHHPQATFQKNERGYTVATSKGNHVGTFVAPGSHFVKKPAQPQESKVSYTGEDPMVMNAIAKGKY